MELYESMMNLANSMGTSFDDTFLVFVCAFVVMLALIGWAFNFFFDFGELLYKAMKKIFLRFWGKKNKPHS